jgi:indole-3-glycerol phosphate synthase
MNAHTTDLLAAILAATRRSVEVRRARRPLRDIEQAALRVEPRSGSFEAALGRAGPINVIAECKRRSPSKGVLRAHYTPQEIARDYERAGASAVSVLTEPTFFDGTLDHLVAVRQSVELPILRKDFVVDAYQLFEARETGADAVLLIVAGLGDKELRDLGRRAHELGLSCLVEVHDSHELTRAIEAGAVVIGVNNRNLRTLEVAIETSEQLIDLIPNDCLAVAESGLRSGSDLRRMKGAGFDAVLIGEAFMTEPSPGDALARLLQSARASADDFSTSGERR